MGSFCNKGARLFYLMFILDYKNQLIMSFRSVYKNGICIALLV